MRSTRGPRNRGLRTVQDSAAAELVVHGLFGVVRNPMYVGVVTMIAGEAVFFLSPWLAAWAVAAIVAFHVRVIVYEEPTLARTFGASWESYRARVPRWLPRLHA